LVLHSLQHLIAARAVSENPRNAYIHCTPIDRTAP
jgi:hypothetical protein